MCGSRVSTERSGNIMPVPHFEPHGPHRHHHHHHHHEHCEPHPHPQPCPPCNHGKEGGTTGEAHVVGDPHVDGHFTSENPYGQETTNFKFDTQGGAGETINLLNSGHYGLHVDAEFKSWHGSKSVTVVGEEHVEFNGLDVDIKPGEVTIDGHKIQDGEYRYCGSTVTKHGSTTTIKTASGEILTVVDRGGYLDTTLKLDHYKGPLAGMLGDAINGHSDPNAMHYAEHDVHIMDGAGYHHHGHHGQFHPGCFAHHPHHRDHHWAGSVLHWLEHRMMDQGFDRALFMPFLMVFGLEMRT